MKLLVLGALGFLGSNLFELTSKRKNLTAYGTSRLPHKKSNIIKVDVTNEQSIKKAIKALNPDIVIWSLMDSKKETELTDLGLVNLLSVIKKDTKLIYISTDAVFVEGVGAYKESDQIGLLPQEAPLSIYVNAKNKGETLIRNRHANHVIIRTGPIYGSNSNQVIENRTLRIIKQIEENQQIEVASNLYRTFVHVKDLADAILELSIIEFNGTLHVGPLQKESYYSFYKKRLKQLGLYNGAVHPYIIYKEEVPYISLDTSLNTQKAKQILKTHFRTV